MQLTIEKPRVSSRVSARALLRKPIGLKPQQPQQPTHKEYLKAFWGKLKSIEQGIEQKIDNRLIFSPKFERYMDEVESVTGIPICRKQRDLIKQEIEQHGHYKLTPEQNKKWRGHFNKHKKEIRAEWEKQTGMKWKTYDEPVVSRKGKIVRQTGGNWDAHEIILSSWKSPHEWWNMTPAPFGKHQNEIHGKNSLCSQIFEQGDMT